MDILSRLKNMKILLVDDDEWIRDSLSIFFEAEGCNLLALETAEEAMETVRQQDFDIVISDYKLPGMDGLEFLRQVKKRHPETLEILITAYGNYDLYIEAIKAGVQDFISKPLTSENVEMSLARIIKNRE
jgi:DNA-binding NtrC family response regulator